MNFYDLTPERQQQVSLSRLFRYIRDYVYPYHPYLRKLYQKSGVDIAKLRSVDDLRRLPVISKTDLQSDPQLFFLRPSAKGAPPLPEGYETEPLRKAIALKYALQALTNTPSDPSALVRAPTFVEKAKRRGLLEWQPIHFHATSGTTGSPTPVMYTHYDFRHAVAEMSCLMVRPKDTNGAKLWFEWTDRAMSLFPGAPHVAFFAPVFAKTLAGLSTFETFGGAVIPTDRQITLFANGAFTSLAAIPSYLVYWLRRASVLYEQQSIPPLRSLKAILTGAEPLSETLRGYIRDLALGLGADPRVAVYQSFGMTEMKWTALECCEGSGAHLNPKYFYPELLHPETREPVKPGEPGVLVFSHVGWRGTALIRYWTGDLVKGGLEWSRCPHCGYTFPRLYPPICRAIQDFTKIKGTRVDLSLLIETVRDTPGVRQFQISLEHAEGADQFSRDLVGIQVHPEVGVEWAQLERRIKDRVKASTEVTPDRVVLEEDGAALDKRLFARNGIKAEYLVDKRAARG